MRAPISAIALGAALGVACGAQAAEPANPPPPAVPARIIAPSASPELPSAVFDIEIRAGAERLWSGSLRVGDRYVGAASYEETTTQAHDLCPDRPALPDRLGTTRKLSFRLNRVRQGAGENLFSARVRWQRSYPSCDGAGSGALEFERQAAIAVGQTVVLEGDAGLTVKLRRRP